MLMEAAASIAAVQINTKHQYRQARKCLRQTGSMPQSYYPQYAFSFSCCAWTCCLVQWHCQHPEAGKLEICFNSQFFKPGFKHFCFPLHFIKLNCGIFIHILHTCLFQCLICLILFLSCILFYFGLFLKLFFGIFALIGQLTGKWQSGHSERGIGEGQRSMHCNHPATEVHFFS